MESQIKGQESTIQDLREQVSIAQENQRRCGEPEVDVLSEVEGLSL